MPAKRARLYDVLALLTVLIVIVIDQWTKMLVVNTVRLYDQVPFPLLGHYLVIERTLNSGAAFSMFKDSIVLVGFIAVAIAVVCYLYFRILNTGPLIYKVVFGLIIGGALGNLIDRAFRGGAVVDFVSFRIPEINFYFAIFNIADACISVGVVLLFILVFFGIGGLNRTPETTERVESLQQSQSTTTHIHSGSLHPTEQDAQS